MRRTRTTFQPQQNDTRTDGEHNLPPPTTVPRCTLHYANDGEQHHTRLDIAPAQQLAPPAEFECSLRMFRPIPPITNASRYHRPP